MSKVCLLDTFSTVSLVSKSKFKQKGAKKVGESTPAVDGPSDLGFARTKIPTTGGEKCISHEPRRVTWDDETYRIGRLGGERFRAFLAWGKFESEKLGWNAQKRKPGTRSRTVFVTN